jgi:hypothetical protein
VIVSFVFVIQQLARLGEEFLHALTFRRLSTNMLMVFVRTALMCTQIISPKVHDNVARLDVALPFSQSVFVRCLSCPDQSCQALDRK